MKNFSYAGLSDNSMYFKDFDCFFVSSNNLKTRL